MKKRSLFLALGLLAVFILWTGAISMMDVQAIGPRGSQVGFATLNGFIHQVTGVHMTLYVITDWLGLVPVAFGFGFAFLGLFQWISRKSLLKVDADILVLGGFYIVTLGAYLFFESFVINYRPVLIEGVLEASYPSSTTMLVLCVMPTTMMQMKVRIKRALCRRFVMGNMAVYAVGMVSLRLLSGVHWFSDIVGGILLSAGLVSLYSAFSGME